MRFEFPLGDWTGGPSCCSWKRIKAVEEAEKYEREHPLNEAVIMGDPTGDHDGHWTFVVVGHPRV